MVKNFSLVTQRALPIRIDGLGAQSQYIDYHSDEAKLCQPRKRAAYSQAFCLQRLRATIQTVSGQDLMPKFKSSRCKSLSRLGFHEKFTGVPCRPILPLRQQTMDLVWQYIRAIGPSGFLDQPLKIPCQPALIDVSDRAEIPPRARFANYSRFLKHHRRNKWMLTNSHFSIGCHRIHHFHFVSFLVDLFCGTLSGTTLLALTLPPVERARSSVLDRCANFPSKLLLFPNSRGWENQPNSRGLYAHYKDSLLKVGWPFQYKELRPWHI